MTFATRGRVGLVVAAFLLLTVATADAAEGWNARMTLSYGTRGMTNPANHREFFGGSVIAQGFEFHRKIWGNEIRLGISKTMSPAGGFSSDPGDRIILSAATKIGWNGFMVEPEYRYANVNFWVQGDQFRDWHEVNLKTSFSPTTGIIPYFVSTLRFPVITSHMVTLMGIGTEIQMALNAQETWIEKNWVDLDAGIIIASEIGTKASKSAGSLKIQATSILKLKNVPFEISNGLTFLQRIGGGRDDRNEPTAATINEGGIVYALKFLKEF